MTLFLITQIILVLIVLALALCIFFGLKHAFQGMQIAESSQKRLLAYTVIGIVFWLSILAALAFSGFFQNFDILPPRIGIALIPPIILTFVLLFSKSFYKILYHIPQSWLIYIQSFRIVMEIFLWLGFIAGFVPPQMTFEWLNFDIIVGITALMAGYTFFGRGRYRRFEAIIWNFFGIVLLLNILLIALLSTPFPFQVFFNEPVNTMVAYFPFIWIPGFVVPFAFAMHVFSLKQLILNKERIG
jgi:hypothetical protein